jgi:GGDEF domain-containing protein
MREILHAELLGPLVDGEPAGVQGLGSSEVRGRMELEHERALRERTQLAVLRIAVDHLERLAQTVGGGRIEFILASVTSVLRTLPRNGDLLAVREQDEIVAVLTQTDAAAAAAAVNLEFRFELEHQLTSLDEKPDQAIIAVVGDEMKGHPGVSGKVFGALGRHNINITAIAQGASERNISCVIDASQQTRALNIIHQSFFEVRKRLALVVIGVGNIGATLLQQLREQQAYLRGRGFDLAAGR